MASPAVVVEQAFTNAQAYASNAQGALNAFSGALSAALYAPPTVNLAWSTVSPPPVPQVGELPTLPEINFLVPGGMPSALSATMPTMEIDDFQMSAPTSAFPAAPTLSYGAAPTLSYGAAPTVPAVGEITVPDAPLITMPAVPTYLSLSAVAFGGINTRDEWLTKLGTIPELDLLSPTPYSYALGPEYASDLLSALKAKLVERMAGGTGLSPAVEQAIWDRARSRETAVAQASQDEVMRASEAFGFQLPTGVLAAQLREAQRGYYDKLSTLSRDVAIKQAELEQENLKQTVSQGMELESKLVDYSYKMEQLAFETAKTYADNGIQAYNAAVERYRALLGGYQTYASAYKTIIDSELAKVEVYKAQLAGEQTKAQINGNLVQQYKTQVEAGMSQVEIYRAQVGAAQTLVQLEQAKIGAAGEQIKAYVAQINAETSKVEAYKVTVQAEAAKVDAYKVTVQAEAAKIEVYKAQTQAYSAKAAAQSEKARAQISWYGALAQAKAAEWDGWKARVAGETARVQALGTQSSALVDGYRAGSAAVAAQGETNARMWEADIKQYEAGQMAVIQTAKINGDFAIHANNARLDAAKVGAQVYAQLASSAYGMINASAGVSASSGTTVNYSYSNDTLTKPVAMTSI